MKNHPVTNRLSASFRDPDGHLFVEGGILYRGITERGKPSFLRFLESGLYDDLKDRRQIIAHEDVNIQNSDYWKVIKPDLIEFISYPQEWAFDQLKDAALMTLKIQRCAIDHDMSLKDASAYNIQFQQGTPVLIDSLSFEPFDPSTPWVAYRQFCQHFLGPLALMAKRDIHLNQLHQIWIDGVPLEITNKLLGWNRFSRFGLFTHIYLHQKQNPSDVSGPGKPVKSSFGRNAHLGILDSLRNTIENLKLPRGKTTWSDYYANTNYTSVAAEGKAKAVSRWTETISPVCVWDMGANDGKYSRIAAKYAKRVVAFDIDPYAVNENYLNVKRKAIPNLLPLRMDLMNPTPSYGWAHMERMSLEKRGGADLLIALALIHHLTISDNLPFAMVGDYFKSLTHWLIIEFIPKSDSMVKKILSHREDIFGDYHQEEFEKSFSSHFRIIEKLQVPESDRILYLMEGKDE